MTADLDEPCWSHRGQIHSNKSFQHNPTHFMLYNNRYRTCLFALLKHSLVYVSYCHLPQPSCYIRRNRETGSLHVCTLELPHLTSCIHECRSNPESKRPFCTGKKWWHQFFFCFMHIKTGIVCRSSAKTQVTYTRYCAWMHRTENWICCYSANVLHQTLCYIYCLISDIS